MSISNERIYSKKQLKEWLCYERKQYPNLSKLFYFLQINEFAVIWKHHVLLRTAEYHINAKHVVRSAISRARLYRFQNKYAMHIPPNVCKKGLKLMHVGPILISSRATVGQNCIFHMNTALVAGGTNNSAPQLGDNVVIGIGAIILGNVQISDGVAIGANAVVNKDVLESNIGVAGVPAKKISNNGRFEWNKK